MQALSSHTLGCRLCFSTNAAAQRCSCSYLSLPESRHECEMKASHCPSCVFSVFACVQRGDRASRHVQRAAFDGAACPHGTCPRAAYPRTTYPHATHLAACRLLAYVESAVRVVGEVLYGEARPRQRAEGISGEREGGGRAVVTHQRSGDAAGPM